MNSCGEHSGQFGATVCWFKWWRKEILVTSCLQRYAQHFGQVDKSNIFFNGS